MESDSGDATGKAIWNVQMFGRLRLSCLLPHAPVVIERFQTQKTALLFAILVGHSEARVSAPLYRSDLGARLWPDAEPEVSRDRLSQALSWLRRNLETNVGLPGDTVIRADRYSIALAPGVVTSDAAQMDFLLKEERAVDKGDAQGSLILLRQALALYEGALLPGMADDDDLLLLERQRLEATFEASLRRAAIAAAESGETALSLEYARRLLQTDAANENHCALLMRLLFRAGDSMGALKAYSDFMARLGPGGVQTSPALGRLAAEIKERAAPVVSAVPAPARSLSDSVSPALVPSASASPPSVLPLAAILPLPLTRYFGREQELGVIQAGLQTRDTRLMTLLGPGGSGKTRLAVEAARRFAVTEVGSAEVSVDTGKAAFFVSLEHISSAAQIMPAVLRVLQQADSETAPEESAQRDGTALRAKAARLLGGFAHPVLVLDNAETVAGGAEAAGVITDLLSRVPALCILATSRARLGVDGEQQMFVPPLPSPHEAVSEADTVTAGGQGDALLLYPSVRMFLDRARHARMDFALTEENREVVAALCGRLEGIPLAIELCAGWAATLSAAEMLGALDSRFDLLVSRRPDVPPRHRSLYAAVESSYLLLPPELKTMFCALSVFRGGWTAQAARAVIGTGDDGGDTEAAIRSRLAALQERSLIFTEKLSGGGMRWRVLETLREFAWSQLTADERTEAAARHARWYLHFAEASLRDQGQMEPRLWLDTLEIEQDNFLSALAAWGAQSPLQEAVTQEAGPNVGREDALTMGLRLCLALDRFWLTRGYSHLASEHLQWLLTRLEMGSKSTRTDKTKTILLARGYTALGRAYAAQGHLSTALAPLETALHRWRGVEDAAGIAGAQMDLGEVCYWLGRREEALLLLRESEAAARNLDDAQLCGAALLTLGSIALDEQDIPRAEGLHLESLEFARRENNNRLMARVLCNLGEIAREQGRLDMARERCEAALKAAELGDRAAACYIRLSLGRTACACGDAQQATVYLQECLRYVARSGTRRLLVLCLLLAAQIAGLESRAERCAVLLGAGSALRDEASLRLIQGEVEQESALVEQARRIMGAAEYAMAYARGALLAPDAAAAYANEAPAL